MSKRILILAPRLDMSFKNDGNPIPPIEKMGPPNHPIRIHWKNFVYKLEKLHKDRGDKVIVKTLPLWQFTKDFVHNFDPDITYVPHHSAKSFYGTWSEIRSSVRYYMQTVFPHLFSIDISGWGGDNTFALSDKSVPHEDYFHQYINEFVVKRKSKFEQPMDSALPPINEPFILFTCQLPHDQNVINQSNVSVENALKSVLNFAKLWNLNLVIKAHPINRAAMVPLKSMVENFGYKNSFWTEDSNIHTLLEHCQALYTVNSGTGLEAILHRKPVFTFGRSDYKDVAVKVEPNYSSLRGTYGLKNKIHLYREFFNYYVHCHFDSTPEKELTTALIL